MSIDICPHCGDYYDQDWHVEHPDECGENPEVMKANEEDFGKAKDTKEIKKILKRQGYKSLNNLIK